MVKYLALGVALVASLVLVDMAQAGRRCKSCGHGYSGCPGGVCPVPVVPGVEAVPVAPDAPVAPAAPAAAATRPAPAVVAAPATQPAPQYFTSYRRGLFGRRR
jgi:hypothetical protein